MYYIDRMGTEWAVRQGTNYLPFLFAFIYSYKLPFKKKARERMDDSETEESREV